jgi:nucleoside-diphosphate-sugar epimerase
LKEGTFLDMMYMPDALRAAVELMEADPSKLIHRNAFNLTAMMLAPETIGAEIKKRIPEFTLDYQIDPLRQVIADSWPNSLDDSAARKEWGWMPEYDLESMTADMLQNISQKLRHNF